jgi:DnaK suppressor protein
VPWQEQEDLVKTSTVRKRLERACQELDQSIAVLQGEKPAVRSADFARDPADAGTSLSDEDRTEAVLHSAMSQRTEILAALQRIQEGSYGTCADCGRPIPEGRLEARPEATRCVACQSKRDRLRR